MADALNLPGVRLPRSLVPFVLGLLLLLAIGASTAVAEVPSDPDPTFSGDGFAPSALPFKYESGLAIAPAPGGKVVVAYYVQGGLSPGTYLTRLMPDGSPDQSFGTGGLRAIERACGFQTVIADLTVLPDGRILTAGACNENILLMRFNADGSDDLNFDGDLGNPGGGNGYVETTFPQAGPAAYHLIVDPADGRITVAGLCCTGVPPSGQDTIFARYTADGRLDPSFDGPPVNPAGGNGRVLIPFDTDEDDSAQALVDLGGGRVAICGERKAMTFVAVLDPTGQLDKSFSSDGIAEVDQVKGNERGDALALDAGGGLVVASAGGGVKGNTVVSRFDPSGNLDAAFGKRTIDPSPGLATFPLAMAIQANGRILIAGFSYVEIDPGVYTGGRIMVARLLPGGEADQSFAPGGARLYTGPQERATAADAALDQSGKLLLAGSSTAGEKTIGLAARILTEPYTAPAPTARPANRFKFAGVKLNKRKGTATLLIEVPGPGALMLAGTKKLAPGSKGLAKAGKFGLTIKLRGKAKKKLASRAALKGLARAKVKAAVTYTPTGGDPLTQTKKLGLVRRAASAYGR